jgi:hypothetical protein
MSKKTDQKYRGNGEHHWEYVTECTSRLRVESGWTYRYGSLLDHDVTMVFVPLAANKD